MRCTPDRRNPPTPQAGRPPALAAGGPSRAGQHRQGRVVITHCPDNSGGLLLVLDRRVVQRAMRFDVAHPGASHRAESVEGAELVEHIPGQFVGCDVHPPAAETGQITVGDVRAHGDTAGCRLRGHRPHRHRVAGVEAAGHVRAGDHGEQRLVVAKPPDAEALAEITVEVDGAAHAGPTRLARANRTAAPGRPARALPDRAGRPPDHRVAAGRRVVGQQHDGWPSGGTWIAPSTIPSLSSSRSSSRGTGVPARRAPTRLLCGDTA